MSLGIVQASLLKGSPRSHISHAHELELFLVNNVGRHYRPDCSPTVHYNPKQYCGEARRSLVGWAATEGPLMFGMVLAGEQGEPAATGDHSISRRRSMDGLEATLDTSKLRDANNEPKTTDGTPCDGTPQQHC